MEYEKHLEAFRRLVADAAAGGQAKVDALLALSQRTIFVVPWGAGVEGYRTLVNSGGLAALPIFSDPEELERAATRFGWVSPDGSTPRAEVGARRAFTYAKEKNIGFVVLDIVADHALEVSRDELEPLLQTTRRDASGPYIGTGKTTSTLMEAVRASRSSETSLDEVRPSLMPEVAPAAPPVPETPPTVLPSQLLFAPTVTPADETLDALDHVLRSYPEVEWACVGNASGTMAIGLRIEPKLRKRFDQIAVELHRVAHIAIIVLDDPAHLRSARQDALVFYPWRRK